LSRSDKAERRRDEVENTACARFTLRRQAHTSCRKRNNWLLQFASNFLLAKNIYDLLLAESVNQR
jgi:hypothetical protein